MMAATVRAASLGAVLLGTSVAGQAADLYRKGPPAALPAEIVSPERVHDWSGFYVGAFGEYAFGPDTAGIRAPNVDVGKLNVNGFGGGVNVGYNYQSGHFVAGVEADVLFSGMRDTVRNSVFGGSVAEAKYDWLVTVRPRVGYAFDNLLIYATAGLAVGGIEYKVAATAPAGAMDVHSTRVGFVGGLGAEYAITDRISVKGEYLLTKLETKTYTFSPGYRTQSIGLANHFRVGLNYRF